ncbi:hypothetical protein JCM14036_14160 [Desulfotomaculum defluvii]
MTVKRLPRATIIAPCMDERQMIAPAKDKGTTEPSKFPVKGLALNSTINFCQSVKAMTNFT